MRGPGAVRDTNQIPEQTNRQGRLGPYLVLLRANLGAVSEFPGRWFGRFKPFQFSQTSLDAFPVPALSAHCPLALSQLQPCQPFSVSSTLSSSAQQVTHPLLPRGPFHLSPVRLSASWETSDLVHFPSLSFHSPQL